MDRWRWLFLAVALVLGGLVFAAPVVAHAVLIQSEPAANASLDEPPQVLRLSFSEPLEPDFSDIRLFDAEGLALDTPPAALDPANPTELLLAPGPLPDGLYTVAWRVVSALDGHPTEGSFAFTIGVVAAPAAAPSPSLEAVPAESVLVRSLNLLAMALAIGGLGFRLLVWAPAGLGPHAAAERHMSALVWAGWAALGIAGVLILLLNAALAEGVGLAGVLSRGSLVAFLTGTRYGSLWMVRSELWLLMGVALVLAGWSPRWLWAALGFGVGILFVHSLFGHAAVAPDSSAAIVGNWLHLLMAALWLGGLAQFVGILLARGSDDGGTTTAHRLIGHFSNYARVTIAGLAVTGLYAAWLEVGSPEALWTTTYGQALLLKLALFAPALLIAAVNLVFTARGLRRGERPWLVRLRGLIGAEIALILGILVATGVMTSVNPARQALASRLAAAADTTPGYVQSQAADGLRIQMTVTPGSVGENRFTLALADMDGSPVTDASLVRLRFQSRERNTGLSGLRLEPAGDGTYQASGMNLSVPGEWLIRVTVQRPNEFDTVVDFVPLIAPGAPAAPAVPEMTQAQRSLALLATGLLALAVGGFLIGRSRAPVWRGAGLLASGIVLAGVLFLVSGLLAA